MPFRLWYNSSMLVKSVKCKLRTSDVSASALADTMQRFNAACNSISQQAWQRSNFRAFDLHKILYHTVRSEFGLPAQLAVRAIAKVTDSYKTDRSTLHTFGERSAVVYDARCMSLKGVSSVSLTTTQGRHSFSLAHGGKQREQLLAGTTGEADLLFIDGNYYLSISVKTPDAPPADTSGGALGIDMGIVEIATDSEGQSFSGATVKAVRMRNREHKRHVQRRRTRSAYKRLQAIGKRVSRFSKDVNPCISKSLVQKAFDLKKALAIEDLKGIRERGNGFNKQMRWQLGNWAFLDLASQLRYKAASLGIPVIEVDPRNTSRTCNSCGHCDKANRKSQSVFHCLQCGLTMNADKHAALNIETRAFMSTSLMFRAPLVREGQAASFRGR